MDLIKQNFLEVTKKYSGIDIELLISGSESTSVSFFSKKLNKFSAHQNQMAGFRVINKGQQGYAFTENLSLDGLKRALHDAIETAEILLEANGPGVEFHLPKQAPTPTLEGLTRDHQHSVEELKGKALALETECLQKDPRVKLVAYSGLSESHSWIRVMNTNGLDHEYEAQNFMGYSYPQMTENDSTKMHGYGVFTRDFSNVDPAKVAEEAIEKTKRALGATPLQTGNYPVLFDREVGPTLIAMIEDYFSAKSVDEGVSLFTGQLGKKIFSEKITMEDNPFVITEPGARPFDSEGSPSQVNTLIEAGVLKSFLTNTEYAKKMNLPLTASASRSPGGEMSLGTSTVVVKKGTDSREAMLKKFDKLVWVTSFQAGLHSGFKDTTGDISMPVEGFLIENGKVVRYFDQTVMSGNVLKVFADVVCLGDEYDQPGANVQIPDILVPEMSFAGS